MPKGIVMIRTVCPRCDTPLMAPDEYEGKSPCCPVCKTELLAEKKSERPSLVDEILAGAQSGDAAASLGTTAAAEPGEAKKPARQRSRAKSGRRGVRSYTNWIVTVVAVLALAGAVVFVYKYVSTRMHQGRIQTVLASVESLKGEIARHEGDGARFIAAKKYGDAKGSYERALSIAQTLQGDLSAVMRRFGAENVPPEIATGREFIDRKVRDLRKVLGGDAIRKGAAGYVAIEGQWVTPEEYKRRFAEKMRNEGKVEYQGKWMTRDEMMKLRGYKKLDDQWLPPEEYARRLKEQEEKKKQEGELARKRREEAERRRLAREAARKAAEVARKRREEELAKRFPPDGALWVLDDFEEKNDWAPANWSNANPVTLKAVKREQSRVLHVAATGGVNDKVAFSRTLGLDWSSRSKLTFDVDSSVTRSAKVGIALVTDTYYESRPKTVRSGMNKAITFDLTAGDFKSQATRWRHSTEVKKRNYVVRIFIVIYYGGKGDFYIDNIYLKK